MLHFQLGTFREARNGFLIVDMDGPPQPIAMLRDDKPDESEEAGNTGADPPITVSKTNKRKAETAVEETDEAKERMLLPSDSDGIIYKTDGTTETVKGPFNGRILRKAIDCNCFQMVPCTVGDLKDKFELWMNEEGQMENEINKQASVLFGKQVFGGKLYGNILVIKSGVVD